MRNLMTHPGVGPITVLAHVWSSDLRSAFVGGDEIGSYLGLKPEPP
jgi:hypothetical protein